MSTQIDLVVFDVNETLSDMRPLGDRMAALGCPDGTLATWFASVLRDGFAVTATGGMVRFAEIAAGNLAPFLRAAGRSEQTREQDVASVLSAFAELEAHPDVPDGLRALADAGVRLVTLTNGSAGMSEPMFTRAGVLELLERRLSVEDVGRWKPAPDPYLYAAAELGVHPARAAMVAVHPWDVFGSQQAGLTGVWLQRGEDAYPAFLPAPDVVVGDLRDLAGVLAAPTF